jgi:transcriptional antiterminator NusG
MATDDKKTTDDEDAPESAVPGEDASEPSEGEAIERAVTDTSEGDDEGDDGDDTQVAGQLGAQRYVMAGFFVTGIAAAYVVGKSLAAAWGKLAEAIWFQKSMTFLARVGEEERAEYSTAIGGVIAIAVTLYAYRRADVRQWTDEVASELSKVTWPDKAEVTNSTVIVIVTSAVATVYLALLDRFWGFVTNLVYGGSLEANAMSKKWYVIQTYSGFENKVKASLQERAKQHNMEDKFGEILIPTETVQNTRAGGKTSTRQKTSLPGYIFVEMEMSELAWHLVKDTPKVTGFIGNQTPTPVKPPEIDELRKGIVEGAVKPKPKVSFEPGDEVRVVEGAFANFSGVVEEVKPEKQKLKVKVSIFGRATPVELEFSQVEKRS